MDVDFSLGVSLPSFSLLIPLPNLETLEIQQLCSSVFVEFLINLSVYVLLDLLDNSIQAFNILTAFGYCGPDSIFLAAVCWIQRRFGTDIDQL